MIRGCTLCSKRLFRFPNNRINCFYYVYTYITFITCDIMRGTNNYLRWTFYIYRYFFINTTHADNNQIVMPWRLDIVRACFLRTLSLQRYSYSPFIFFLKPAPLSFNDIFDDDNDDDIISSAHQTAFFY